MESINRGQLIGVNYAFKIGVFKEFEQLANFNMIFLSTQINLQ